MKVIKKIFFALSLVILFAGLVPNFSFSSNSVQHQLNENTVEVTFFNPTTNHKSSFNHLLFEVEEDDKLSQFHKTAKCFEFFKLYSFEAVNLFISEQIKNKVSNTLTEFFKLTEPPIFILIRVLII